MKYKVPFIAFLVVAVLVVTVKAASTAFPVMGIGSLNHNDEDNYMLFEALSALAYESYVPPQNGYGRKLNYKNKSFMDINGDGMTDLITHQYGGDPFSGSSEGYYVEVNLANGTLGYDRVYRCNYHDNKSDNNPPNFTFDCNDQSTTLKTSTQKNPDDTWYEYLNGLRLMTNDTDGTSARTANSLVDLNGDGFVDILKHYEYVFGSYYEKDFAVYLNKGDVSFERVYVCEYNNSSNVYKGDCAK